MSASWYVERGGKRAGPYTSAQLKELVASGRLQPTDMVANETMEKAIPAARVKGLFPAKASPPAPSQVSPDLPGTPPQRPGPVPASTETPAPTFREKFSSLPGWQKGLAGLGVVMVGFCLFSAVVGVILNLAGYKPSGGIAKDQGRGGDAAQKDTKQQGGESPATSDFSKVDYSFDFSKVDYSPPAGTSGTTRSGIVREAPKGVDRNEKGMWEKAEGYLDKDEKFVRHGKRTLWFDKEEKDKYKEQHWLNGKQHGVERAWNRKGQMILECPYVEGEVHGVMTRWYNNGQKELVSPRIRGKPHGIGTKWYEDGQKQVEETLIDGRMEGTQQMWWPNGKLREETEYHNDVKHGKFTAWDREGNMTAEGQFKEGKGVGTWGLGFRPRGGGALYYVEFQEGAPWRGGTKAAFLARLANGSSGTTIIYPREGECHCIVSHEWFLDTFGKPQQDVGRDRVVRRWAYRCSDGVLQFKAGVDPIRGIVNLNTD